MIIYTEQMERIAKLIEKVDGFAFHVNSNWGPCGSEISLGILLNNGLVLMSDPHYNLSDAIAELEDFQP